MVVKSLIITLCVWFWRKVVIGCSGRLKIRRFGDKVCNTRYVLKVF